MNVSEVMTRNVITIKEDSTKEQAARLLARHRISGLPVINKDGNVVGVVTEYDVIAKEGQSVGDIMTRGIISVTPDTDLDTASHILVHERIRRLPVLDQGKLVGIVSRLDLLRALLRTIEAERSEDRSDDDIREQILAELAKAAWVPRDGLSISVKDGVVDLNGVILEEKERQALRIVAENTPGVRAVEDHLVWIEPVSGTVFDSPQDQRTPTHR